MTTQELAEWLKYMSQVEARESQRCGLRGYYSTATEHSAREAAYLTVLTKLYEEGMATLSTSHHIPLDETVKLFIDDIRNPPDDTWIVARTYDEAIRVLDTGLISKISFDHDLGETGQYARTGYDIVNWIENKVRTGEWTFIPWMTIHSANPVGRDNMVRAIRTILRFAGE